MKLVFSGLVGAVVGGLVGFVGPFLFALIIHSGQAPLNFFWTAPLGIILGLVGGLVYAGTRQGPG